VIIFFVAEIISYFFLFASVIGLKGPYLCCASLKLSA
jgi:hypothetical protein